MSNITGVASRTGVVGTFVSVPVVILNGLTVIWMIQLRAICTKQKVLFIGHLAADLLVGCFTLIEAQATIYGQGTITFCYVNCYAGHIFGTITSLMAVLQTADKFLILRFTYWYSAWVTWQKVLIMVIFVYIGSVAAVFGLLFVEFDINVVCSVVTIGGKIGYIFLTILYIFCIFVITVMWIFIGKTVKKHRRSINEVSNESVVAKEVKQALTIGIIMCLYGVCYMPSVVYLCLLLQNWDTREQYLKEHPTAVFVVFILANSLVNPIVYIWRLKFYRNSCVSKMQMMFSGSSSASTQVTTIESK